MALRKINHLFIFIYIILNIIIFCECQKDTNKLVKKPGKFKFSPIDLEFRFIEQDNKIEKNFLNKIKKLTNSVKSLLKILIYTNLNKKSITLNQNVLDNFEIQYSSKEALLYNPETLSKNLIALFNFDKLRTKLFKTTIYKV